MVLIQHGDASHISATIEPEAHISSPYIPNKITPSTDYDRMLATAKHAEDHARRGSSVSSQSLRLTRRASFTSVKENLQIPQTFTSSTSNGHQETEVEPQDQGILSGTIERWNMKGLRKFHSHSLTNLKNWFGSEMGWTFGGQPDQELQTGKSALERLPQEVVDLVLVNLTAKKDPRNPYSRHSNLLSCLLVSKSMFTATLPTLYKHISIPHPMMFSKAIGRIRQDPELATLIHRLDFSHYTNIGWSRSRQESTEAANLNPVILLECLEMTSNLKEFLVHEHLDDELDHNVLTKLTTLPSMRALDFCACGSRPFVEAFSMTAIPRVGSTSQWQNIERLSLHECTTLPEEVFENLFPQLPRLTHLDVAHTLVTDSALFSIPTTARLTHLNLSRCTRITGDGVVDFLKTHQAVKNTLICLNLMADAARYRLLSSDDVSALLPSLPSVLRSLNLGGANLTEKHVPLLLPLIETVEELGMKGAKLSIQQLKSLFKPASQDEHVAFRHKQTVSSVHYLDLSGMTSVNAMAINYELDFLLSTHGLPLEVIELSDGVIQALKKQKRSSHVGWEIVEFGRRGWFVRRLPANEESMSDNGSRDWKMGAQWWGAKKIPVAFQEVGGMYGYYMFKN